MKRLLSWLLALVMIISCLPMSVLPAFAAEPDVDLGTDTDFDVNFPDLVGPTYIDLSEVVKGPGTSFQVTVPAGESVYYKGSSRYAGLVATVDGETEIPLTVAGDNFVYLTITNDTEEEKTYTVVVDYPLGSYDNPVVIESMEWYNSEVTQAAGDMAGYYYTYTATETGNVTFSVDAVYDDNYEVVDCGIQDIAVTNLNTYASYTLQNNGEDNYGLELVVPVEAGQTLLINTSWIEDAAGNAYPAGTYSWTGYFTYPAGTEQNPNAIKWNWNEDGTTATASVTVESDGQYYTGVAGMILTVDGVETAMDENGKFTLTAGEHALQLATPAGAWNNPAQLVIGENTATVAAGSWGGYMYTWTAEEAGTLSLTMPSDQDWFYVINNTTTGVYGDGQWSDSDPVANPGTIEVAAGDVLSIEVNTYNPEDPYNNPGGTVTFTAAFEAASKCDHDSLKANSVCGECGLYKIVGSTTNLGNSLQMGFFASKTYIPATSYAVITQAMGDGTIKETIIRNGDAEWVDYNTAMWRINYNGLAAKHMADEIVVTFYDADGNVISTDWVDSMRAFAMRGLANATSSAKMKTALVDMLNYGAAAQDQFTYNQDDYANSLLTDEQKALATADVSPVNTSENNGFVGSVLTLNNEIAFDLLIMESKMGASVDTTYAVVEYTNHNGAAISETILATEMTDAGSYRRFSIPGIGIADYNQNVVTTLYDAEGNVLASFTDSINSYVARAIASAEFNGTEPQAVFVCVLKFGISAWNYFHA